MAAARPPAPARAADLPSVQTLPLDIWDFREFLPILNRTHGGWAQFVALLDYYAHHGRMNPLFYATFVVQYHWFGVDASGWQWLRSPG